MAGRVDETATRLFREADRFMRRNLGDRDLDLVTVASELYTSPRTVQRAFQSVAKTSFRGYLFRLRMERALAMLQADEGLAVRHVAVNVGYGSGPALAKAMRRHYGKSPHELRDEAK